jgi:N-methylhydantoinase A
LKTYGYRADREVMEITNIRVMGRQTQSPASQTDLTAIGPSLYASRTHRASRKAYFGRDVGLVEVPVVSRGNLTSRATKGPMIIEEYDTTIVAPPGSRAHRDDAWNVILEWEK